MAFADVYTGAYRDRYGSVSRADVYAGTYTDSYGSPFPQAPLDVRAELGMIGWTDITGDVYQRDGTDPITITRGRADESSQANPGTAAMQWNNRSGKYSPRNPLGPYYGLFGRNTPVRISVPSLEPALRIENDSLSGAFCPDAGQLDITGQIDIRIDVTLSSYLPCVLASKWLGTTTTTTTTPPPVPGATVFQANYSGSGSQLAASKQFDSYLGGGRTPALAAQRVYNSPGQFPTSMDTGTQALLNNKCQLVVSWKPATDGSDWTALSASISAYLTAAAAAGAPVPMLLFHHEPQGDFPASTFISMMKIYYPLSKAAYPQAQVGYCALGVGTGTVAAYYPGDAFCDFLMQDIYGNMWRQGAGSNLNAMMSIAQAATPPKPVGIGEFGETTSLSHRLTVAQFTNFINYLIAEFTAVAQAGYPCGPVMWFNGQGGPANHPNVIVAGDPRIPALQAWYDAMASISGGSGTVTSSQRSWALVLNGDGTLGFWWTSDGTLATVRQVTSTLPIPAGRGTLRVYASGGTVTFYWAPGGNAAGEDVTGGPPWTSLGSVAGQALSIYNSTAALTVGYNAALTADYPAYSGLTGLVHELAVRSYQAGYSNTYTSQYPGSPTGIAVADPGFSGQVPGATSFTDSAGNPWTLTGTAELSQRSYRFHGEMSSLPVQWDPSGADVWAPVEAGGLLRRMSQGQQPPVSSAFKRKILGLSGANAPVAYWPCEDTAGSTQIGPAIGDAPMTFSKAPQFASDTSFACSLALPVMNFSQWKGPVGKYSGTGAVVVRFLMDTPASPGTSDDTLIARVNTTGTLGDFTLRYKSGGQLRLTGYGGGAFVFDTGPLAQFDVRGQQLLVSMELTKTSTGTSYRIATLTAGAAGTLTTATGTFSGRPGHVTNVYIGDPGNSLGSTAIGHVFVQNSFEAITDFAQALAAYAGETCASRFARLCGENGIAVRIIGPPGLDVAMGAQVPDSLLNLLQLCEDTGRGQIFEPRQSLALGYRTVRALCQQRPAVTADYSLAQLGDGQGGGLVPVEDDQHTVNDVSVTSDTGGSFEVVLNDGSAMSISPPPDGVGDYGNSYSVNPATDTGLANIGGWILNTGTVEAERYPTIPYHLARPEAAPVFFAVQGADAGDYHEIISTPAFLPPGPVKQLIYGTTEVLGGFQYRVTFNTVPEAPYETGIYADPVYGHMDTDGAQLDADIGTADTTFFVDTTGPSGIAWTTNAADFPFDVIMGGEQVTVLGIGVPSADFLTGDNSGFEASLGNWAAGANCTIARTTAHHHTGAASMAITSTGVTTETALSCAPASILAQGMPVSPGDECTGSAWFKAASSGRFCAAAIDWYTSAGVLISTTIGAALISKTTGWQQATVTGNAPAGAAFAALDLQVATTALDAGLVTYADDAQLSDVTAAGNPSQQFTVTRSVNGVVKAHPAGEPVSLAYPAIIALA